jgi:hypothetical protein
MPENPYRVRGIGVAVCRGRQREQQKVIRQLNDNHVSVVGPRHIGKTVLLRDIADYISNGVGAINGTLYWDLRERTIASDADFFHQLRIKLAGPIAKINASLRPDLEKQDDQPFETIRAVFELLQEENKRLLICLDGFDALDLGVILTQNMLDNLRSLAEGCSKSVRILTASRKRLRDHCNSVETRNSPFHNIFPDPVALCAFTPEQFQDVLRPFHDNGSTLERGADTELFNWSGGIPILVGCICRAVWSQVAEGKTMTTEIVRSTGISLQAEEQDYLQDLWDDCSEEQRSILAGIAVGSQTELQSGLPKSIQFLFERGILAKDGSRLAFRSSAMKAFADGEAGSRSAFLKSFFGDVPNFRKNMKSLLQLKYESTTGDQALLEFIGNAISNLERPAVLLTSIRAVVDRAFDLIWGVELPDHTIPVKWTEGWKYGLKEPMAGHIPEKRALQCRLLELMTGERRQAPTRIRRSTYIFLDNLQKFGNFGAHLRGETPEFELGVTACFMALQLTVQVAADLSSDPR